MTHRGGWLLTGLLLAGLLTACTSDSNAGPPPRTVASLRPSAATVGRFPTELQMDVDSSISPSGDARVAFGRDGWCLEDASAVTCVDALAEGSAADGIIWRPDERAVAISWGSQDPISIVDFDTATAVETSLENHRLLAWSPDGQSILGLDIDAPEQFSLIDPVTLDARKYADFDGLDVPRLFWVDDDLIVGSSSSGPAVFVLDTESGARQVIDGGIGEQDLRSVSGDGSFAVSFDDDVGRELGGPDDSAMLLFDTVDRRSAGVVLPDDLEPQAVQISADGGVLLVLAGEGSPSDQSVLLAGSVDAGALSVDDWTELISDFTPTDRPASFNANDVLRWTGDETAWLISEDEGLLQITLTD